MNSTKHFANVNNSLSEIGCHIDSHHGQYGPDMLDDLFTMLVRPLDEHESPQAWRLLAETAEQAGREEDAHNAWEAFHESADALVDMLNDVTEEGFVWAWMDGDFMLMSVDDLD